jgi:hypothetical protein
MGGGIRPVFVARFGWHINADCGVLPTRPAPSCRLGDVRDCPSSLLVERVFLMVNYRRE